MAPLPVEVLVGVYLGVLTGIIPAVVAWGLGFTFKYFTGVSIPAFAVVVLTLAIAGANGGLLAVTDPTVTTAPNAPTLVTAILVVLMISLYAHAKGDEMGAALPRHFTLRGLKNRMISRDVVELVGEFGQVRVTPAGDVADMEGFPPLPADLRRTIREDSWLFPADLPIGELEVRLADKLEKQYDLADVTVSIDDRAQAHISAAPPSSGVSKRVPPGNRAVSVEALLPTGVARGDEVRVFVPDGDPINATVVSARTYTDEAAPQPDGGPATDSRAEPAQAPVTDGGPGRLTVAVRREAAARLLGVTRAPVIVLSRGIRREFEVLSLLRQAGKQFRRYTVTAGSDLDGVTIAQASVRDTYGVAILAARRGDAWSLVPRGATQLSGGNELFVVGTRENLAAFEAVVG